MDLERSAESSSSWFQTMARFSLLACRTAEIEIETFSGSEKWRGTSPPISKTAASAFRTSRAIFSIFGKRVSGSCSSRRILTTSSIFSVATRESGFIIHLPRVSIVPARPPGSAFPPNRERPASGYPWSFASGAPLFHLQRFRSCQRTQGRPEPTQSK